MLSLKYLMYASTSAWGSSTIHYYLRWFVFLSCLLSVFFLCSSLTWCSLSFSWMNSLPHSSHLTIGWWCTCLAWLISSTYFANFSPHWPHTSFSFFRWRIPKLFLYNLKWIAIKRFFTLLARPPVPKALYVEQLSNGYAAQRLRVTRRASRELHRTALQSQDVPLVWLNYREFFHVHALFSST